MFPKDVLVEIKKYLRELSPLLILDDCFLNKSVRKSVNICENLHYTPIFGKLLGLNFSINLFPR
ncbi:MAG TPA: hypothetical protein DCX03_01875 [Bacteroidales bacterium]|nr:hypothetical protein [Bacteroidales bacterium]